MITSSKGLFAAIYRAENAENAKVEAQEASPYSKLSFVHMALSPSIYMMTLLGLLQRKRRKSRSGFCLFEEEMVTFCMQLIQY